MLSDNEQGHLSEKEVNFAQSIYDSGTDLLGLINDILDLSRIEAGKLDVALAPVTIESLCADLEKVFRPIASEKNLAFGITIGQDVPPIITTDQQRLEQILKNLLSNACKFTESGSVELRVAREDNGQKESSRLTFTVADSGIGISSRETAAHLRGLPAGRRRDEPSVRRLRAWKLLRSAGRSHSFSMASCELRARRGKGAPSPCSCRPRATPEHAARPNAQPEPTVGGSCPMSPPKDHEWAGTRVVLVDDDLRNLYALASALEARGIEALCADSARQGLKIIEATPDIDLVLIDLMMPEMDGYEAIREIRKMPGCTNLAVIAVTAKAMRGDREECFDGRSV